MASLELQGICKSFSGVDALVDVAITVDSGEFFTLLGPSGCGKTTLLRTVAGFTPQDRGRVFVDSRCIDDTPAHKRDAGMVFQDYAIFPHLSVGENVAFGLRHRGVRGKEIAERVTGALLTARLAGYENRMPHELSGGQQQRVGLARAMVIRPQVLLMDEPLSNLDAKLRVELREDIRDLQRSLGITTLYVTHDQEEALVVSDRICIMNHGVVEQIGTAWEIYKEPQTRFVADFVGSMNFLDRVPSSARIAARTQSDVTVAEPELCFLRAAGEGPVAAIRPEEITVAVDHEAPPDAAIVLEPIIRKVTFTGREAQYVAATEDGVEIIVHESRPSREHINRPGQPMRIALPLDSLLYFERDSGRRL